MRILHLASHCHEIGNGIMNVAVDFACRQAQAGHQVAFASAGGSYVALLRRYGVEHFELVQNWRRPWTLPRALAGLRRILRQSQPDILHAHMMTGALLGRALRPMANWRLVTTVHNEWQRSAIAMIVGDKVIAVSAAVAEQMARRGIPASRLEVVRNGPLGSPRQPSASAAGPSVALPKPAILTVAGLYERKGIADLIRAFELVAAAHPTASLHIVGDGPDRARFEAQARHTACHARIHFAGFQQDPGRWYRAADIFVLASHSEPFGLVLAEARDAGCAIVGCHVGGIPEVLDGGRAGLLVPPHAPDRLAEALSLLLADPCQLAAWREAARQGLDWLSVGRAAEEAVEVYRLALAPAEETFGAAPPSGQRS